MRRKKGRKSNNIALPELGELLITLVRSRNSSPTCLNEGHKLEYKRPKYPKKTKNP
jgi:hypothetical protein